MKDKTTNILIVGVGGQGSLLASKILSSVVQNRGFDVKLSEIHGMAQRGGSVVTQLRYGESVNSPLISVGEADYILSFELLEGLRWSPYLTSNGLMVINRQKIDPMPVTIGLQQYPEDIEGTLTNKSKDTVFFDGLTVAKNLGNAKVLNVVLIGVLARYLPFELEDWLKAIEDKVPSSVLELNKKAFLSGYEN